MAEEPWYKDGLNFTCTRCGKCCGGAPGYVWISEDEIHAAADHLGMEAEAFRRRYTHEVYRRGVSLVEKPDYDCIFFEKGHGCTIYNVRPQQCRTWPFWRPLLASRADWDEGAAGCPGMNTGERHDAAVIERIVANDGLA